MQVAVVDFTAPDAPAAFAESMHATGFGALVGTPVSQRLLDEIAAEWLAFFATPAKHGYRQSGDGQDGYFPYEAGAGLAGGAPRDRKEFFHVCPSGRYPREVSDRALAYYAEAEALAATLLGWIEEHSPATVRAGFPMPLPEMLDGASGSMLRVQHYLPMTGPGAPGPLRAVAHTDINLLTVLPAPTEPGLQLLSRDGTWQDIPCLPGSVIVNGGEMLEILSGGRYPATLHRVVNPTGSQSRGSRLSMPLFLQAAKDVDLGGGRTAASYRRERIAELATKGWRVVPGGDE